MKIRLFCLNVVASFRRALIDALGETSLLDKPPHHFKSGFHRGGYLRLLFLRLVQFHSVLSNSSIFLQMKKSRHGTFNFTGLILCLNTHVRGEQDNCGKMKGFIISLLFLRFTSPEALVSQSIKFGTGFLYMHPIWSLNLV